MKKILTLTALFLFAFTTMTKAQFVLGGNIGFSSNTSKDEPSGDERKSTSINLVPRLGYIFGDNWAGLEVGFNSSTQEGPTGLKNTTNLTTIAPFFRHNFVNANNMGVWLEAQAGMTFGKSEFDGTETSKFSGFGAGLRPGVIFYVTDHLSFEASFGRLAFSQLKEEDPDNSDNSTTDTDFGFELNGSTFLFGVNYSFGGGSED